MFHPPVLRQLSASVLIFLTLSVSARADIIVQSLEFRAGIGDRPGIIFGQLTSDSAKPDRLIAVESPDARIELHTHEMRDNIMRMRRVDAFSLPPGKNLVLESGGHHLMVFDFVREADKTPLRLTFRFEEAPAVTTQVPQSASHKVGHHKHH
ncbi:MAG: copper chaperone PCu(A)C [Pseudomonadota bacterium]|nr:copper chaperone PCu(A)C [Pseudomonadota bacterium]